MRPSQGRAGIQGAPPPPPPPPASPHPSGGSRESIVMPVASRQSSQPVFFNDGMQATIFVMGLTCPSPQEGGGPAGAPNVPPQRAGTIAAAAWEGKYGRDLVPTISSLCAIILQRRGTATGRWAPDLLIGPPPLDVCT